MSPTLQHFVMISAVLFSIGLLAALSRRHAIFILIGIEMMLAAANINFIAFYRFSPEPQQPTGLLVAVFSIAIAAAEAAAWRRAERPMARIINDALNGAAGIAQRCEVIQLVVRYPLS